MALARLPGARGADPGAHARAARPSGELVPGRPRPGPDSLLLLPPTEDVVIGLWRAEAIVTGERIKKVVFLVDGKVQLTTLASRPYSAELRLEQLPHRADGARRGVRRRGQAGRRGRGDPQPAARRARRAHRLAAQGDEGARATTRAKAEVVVPDGRRIETVEFRVNDQPWPRSTKPPWEATVPRAGRRRWSTSPSSATLDDGTRAEAVRYLRAPSTSRRWRSTWSSCTWR